MAASIPGNQTDLEKSETTAGRLENEPKEALSRVHELEPQHVNYRLERWNQPKINAYRYLSALFTFVIMGMNDAAIGALIPYLEDYYDVNYTIISFVFLASFISCSAVAFLNNRIHMRFGQLGVAIIAPTCKIVTYVVISIHPPYPVLPVITLLSSFGSSLQDGALNAWIGNMESANEMLGLLHGAYGLGAVISPIVATAMVAKAGLQWYTFFYVMVGGPITKANTSPFLQALGLTNAQLGLSVVELILSPIFFRKATGAAYRAAHVTSNEASGQSRTREALKSPVTWICALFLLLYIGVEVSLGGWLVTFMLRVRNGEEFECGLVVTGFWLGITLGRVVLGFVTGKLGEKISIAAYIVICLGLVLCFWLIPNFVASAVFAGWLGFFLGPLFPAVVVVATKLLPPRLHVSAIGFAAAFGGGGSAVLPFAIGAIAQAKGVQVLQPIALAILAAILALWCMLPGGFRKSGLEDIQRKRDEGRAAAPREREATGLHGRMARLRVRIFGTN
ncbi:major facilitator superfamily transporter [Diplocarpon mali]|nr:major facilitator superfamily transporter [Diplocarpon mali]